MAKPYKTSMEHPNLDGLTPDRIMQLAWGYAPPLILQAALHHHVFDVLDSGPMTIQELENATGASSRGLSAILHALVALDFLTKDPWERFALTPESSTFLVSTKASFQGGILQHCSQQLIPAWLSINDVVASGSPAVAVNQEKSGENFFHKFVEDLFPLSYPAACLLAKEFKIPDHQDPFTVLDLAAGSGVWGIALAQQSDMVKVTAVDWPGVIWVTRRTVTRLGLAKRFRFVAGDLLDVDFGEGYQAATLGHILHSEGEQRSRDLLHKVYHSLAMGGRIAIAEFLVDDTKTYPLSSALFAVNMLVNTDYGDTYSFGEIRDWLSDVGFIDIQEFEAPGPSPLILAKKP